MSKEIAKKEETFIIEQNKFETKLNILQENLQGSKFDFFDLERIVFPKTLFWSVPDENEEEQPIKEIEGVIVYMRSNRIYYINEYDPNNIIPPDCVSQDGITGAGDPGGECEICPLSKFRPGKDSAPLCSERKLIMVLKKGEFLPIIINLPPTSLKPIREYFIKTLSLKKDKIFYEVVTGLSLQEHKQNPIVKLRYIRNLIESELDFIYQYKERMSHFFAETTVEQTDNENQ